MTPRLCSLQPVLKERHLDAFLVTDDTSIRYLTGYAAHDSWFLMAGGKAFLVTDSRYTLEAQKCLSGSGVRVAEYRDSISKETVRLARKSGVTDLGFDERHINVAFFRRLKEEAGSTLRLKRADGVVDVLRMVKEPTEIFQIRKALNINHKLFDIISKIVRPGLTERYLLERLQAYVRRQRVEFSFPPIIASGPNSAMPHARVSERKLLNNEPLLVDMGIDLDGYKSDLTRMFFLGKITRHFKETLHRVREAQLAAFARIRPGVLASEVDAAARRSLGRVGLARFFGHSLGHGVGLDIHEMPRISAKSGVVLKENMVFTVEPGVYYPDRFGIRLEEMVLVTQSGCEVLSGDYDY